MAHRAGELGDQPIRRGCRHPRAFTGTDYHQPHPAERKQRLADRRPPDPEKLHQLPLRRQQGAARIGPFGDHRLDALRHLFGQLPPAYRRNGHGGGRWRWHGGGSFRAFQCRIEAPQWFDVKGLLYHHPIIPRGCFRAGLASTIRPWRTAASAIMLLFTNRTPEGAGVHLIVNRLHTRVSNRWSWHLRLRGMCCRPGLPCRRLASRRPPRLP